MYSLKLPGADWVTEVQRGVVSLARPRRGPECHRTIYVPLRLYAYASGYYSYSSSASSLSANFAVPVQCPQTCVKPTAAACCHPTMLGKPLV